MKTTIFYSWQSDSPQSINRNFIEEALQGAIDKIGLDSDLKIEPAIDRDTKDTPGSPAIADTILQKIDQCGIFLCDVTIISSKEAKRASPNPNVLIELGYAIAKVGWDRVICVMNEEYGGPTKLPFDLQHRRWPVRYRLSSETDTAKISDERQHLEQNLELAVRTVLSSGVLTSTVNPKDRRVAVALAKALVHFRLDITTFFSEFGDDRYFELFQEDFPDVAGTQFPDPDILKNVIPILAQADLSTQSNTQIGEHRLTWAEAFIDEFTNISQQCNVILDRYADRDETLIALVEEVGERAHILGFMIHASFTRPELAAIYDKGMPAQHLDFFRYFLLTVIKAYRVIREYGGE